eukprot:IDg17051t1
MAFMRGKRRILLAAVTKQLRDGTRYRPCNAANRLHGTGLQCYETERVRRVVTLHEALRRSCLYGLAKRAVQDGIYRNDVRIHCSTIRTCTCSTTRLRDETLAPSSRLPVHCFWPSYKSRSS